MTIEEMRARYEKLYEVAVELNHDPILGREYALAEHWIKRELSRYEIKMAAYYREAEVELIDEHGAALHQMAYIYEPSPDPISDRMRNEFASGYYTLQQLSKVYKLSQREVIDRLRLSEKDHLDRLSQLLLKIPDGRGGVR